jgi:hypothetical protein
VNWYKTIIASEIPYGYWISPEGNETPVPQFKHEFVALDLGFGGSDSAMNKGWLRLVTDTHKNTSGYEVKRRKGADCSCQAKWKPTLPQIIKARKLFENALCDENKIHVESADRNISDLVPLKQLNTALTSKFTDDPSKMPKQTTPMVEPATEHSDWRGKIRERYTDEPAPVSIQNKLPTPKIDRNMARQRARAANNPLLKQK